ncbi:hypothetical protein [Taibaiella chishuiensis]|uniref:Uncharacterized protein n=1 Tax=Taibaiella chishuiensis TaxID=1434707 RepID=A0A2P8D0T8_9BACT|nr:hypothetical protein [Taibaiella chishuiensis]PSK90817.1 hypothetical protein B0I18_107229 [Taibaiella chishuiensis]
MYAEIIAAEQCPQQNNRWVVIEMHEDVNLKNFILIYTHLPKSNSSVGYPVMIYDFPDLAVKKEDIIFISDKQGIYKSATPNGFTFHYLFNMDCYRCNFNLGTLSLVSFRTFLDKG